MGLDGFTIRRVLLEVCVEIERRGPGVFQSIPVLREADAASAFGTSLTKRRYSPRGATCSGRALLRGGTTPSTPDPPFLHLPEIGRRALANLSRDPYNPGYMAVVRPLVSAYPIALSYIEEASKTFLADCMKASTVMVGAAAEALVLSTRDVLVARLSALGAAVPSKLSDWRVKTVRDAIETLIDSKKSQLDNRLYERFSAFWVPVSDQMRLARNDAGHPVSVDPVTHETVRAALLLFPEFARLIGDLDAWITSSMT